MKEDRLRAAEEEERRRAREAEERAAQDRQRDRERAEIDIRNIQGHINDLHEELDGIYKKYENGTVTTNEEYQELDQRARAIHEQLEWEHIYMEDAHRYIDSLNQQDEDWHRRE